MLAIAAAAAVIATSAVGVAGPVSPAAAVTTAASGSLQGHVTVPSGIDATKYTVQVDTLDQNMSIGGSFLSAAGEFSIGDIPAGQYRATVRERNGNTLVGYQTLRTAAGPTEFAISAGQTADVNFTLQRTSASISGTIDLVGYDRLVIATKELINGTWIDRDNLYDGSGQSPVSYTSPKLSPGTHAVFIYVEDDVLPSEVYYYGSATAWSDPVPITVGTTNLAGFNHTIPRSFTAPDPIITGTPRVGTAVTATLGTWQPVPEALTYQWSRTEGEMIEGIPGATGASYVPTAADIGKQLQLMVVGTKTQYRDSYKFSELSPKVTAGTLTAPVPTVTGTAKVGQTLTATAGTWGPNPVTLKYQWLRAGTAITGATGTTYQAVTADAGKKLSVTVTGAKTGYTTAARTSTETAAVTAADPLTFTTTPTPTIAGTAQVGKTLTATPGTWVPAADTLKYQWLRSGTAITGATGTTYQAVAADAGKKLSVTVTGTKTGYTTAARTSTETAAVTAADPLAFTTTPTPTIAGTAQVGKTLTATPGAWVPAADTLKYQWLRAGTAITGATGTSYALVAADEGTQVSVKVTGVKTGYVTATKTSAATARVARATYVPPATSPFSDLQPGAKFYKEIAWMFDTGISTGVRQPDGSRAYQPKNNVTREAMAAFLYRIAAEPGYRAPATSHFADLKPSDKFYTEISWMYDEGISTGVKQANGTRAYQPKTGVTREAMAAFMYRLDENPKPSAPKVSPFNDILVGQKFYREISWMYTSGLSTGIKQPSGKPSYAPKNNVTREAMAAFLFRAENPAA